MKTLREILIDHMLIANLIAIETPLETDLLTWAKAYGDQIRHVVRDECIAWDGASTLTDRLRDLKLPEPP